MENCHGCVLWLLAASVAKRTSSNLPGSTRIGAQAERTACSYGVRASAFAICAESAIPLANAPVTSSRRSIIRDTRAARDAFPQPLATTPIIVAYLRAICGALAPRHRSTNQNAQIAKNERKKIPPHARKVGAKLVVITPSVVTGLSVSVNWRHSEKRIIQGAINHANGPLRLPSCQHARWREECCDQYCSCCSK
jgi:hypothetical protein